MSDYAYDRSQGNYTALIFFQEQAKEFISMDNLEEEIERVLNTRTSYDFAIDSDGNKIQDEIQSSDNRSEKVHSSS